MNNISEALNIPDTFSASVCVCARAIINMIIALSSSRTLASPGSSCVASAIARRKYRQLIFARRPGLAPQPEGTLEAERLSLIRLSRCVIHSALGCNNIVRKGMLSVPRDTSRSIFRTTLKFLSLWRRPAQDTRLQRSR